MRMVVRYLRPYFSRMTVQLIIKLAGSLMDLFLPWILSYVLDDIVPLGEISKIVF